MECLVDHHGDHGGTDAENRQEVNERRDYRENDRVFMESCEPEYDERFDRGDDEQYEVASENTEDQERELV